MKVTAILGSRNRKGQTAQAAEAFLGGLEGKKVAIERFFLPTMKIERCRQCDDNGWGICITKGRCVIRDDFAKVVRSIVKSDAVVFANPVYFGDQSESMRAFLDRLRRTCRSTPGKKVMEGRKAVGICVAGGGGGGAPECSASMQKVLGTCGFEVVDMIPVRRQNLEVKLKVLKTAAQGLSANW